MVSLWTESEELDSRCGQSITELIPRGREVFLRPRPEVVKYTWPGRENTQNQWIGFLSLALSSVWPWANHLTLVGLFIHLQNGNNDISVENLCQRLRTKCVNGLECSEYPVSSSGTVPCSQTVWMPAISYSSQKSPFWVTCSFLTMVLSLQFWHLFLHFYLPSDHSDSGFATHHLEQSWHLLLENKTVS